MTATFRRSTAAAAAGLAGGLLLCAAPTARASAWQPLAPIPFPDGQVTDVAIAATGPGDATAAVILNGDVHAYTATDGVWTHHSVLAPSITATDVMVTSDGNGHTVVAWEQNVSGDDRILAKRQVGPDSWSAWKYLTPAGTDVVGDADIAIAGNGRLFATATVDPDGTTKQVIVTEWAVGQEPANPKTLSPADSWNPAIDVNAAGEAVVAYTYTGLIDDIVDVHTKQPGEGWSLGHSAGADGPVASSVDVAISANGTGQVVWATAVADAYRVQTSRVLANGTVTNAEGFTSPADEFASDPTVDMNATGSALFAWTFFKNGSEGVRYATAASGASPATSGVLPNTLDGALAPLVRISDGGLRMIQHTGGGNVMTHYRSGPLQWSSVATNGAYTSANALDIDVEGNAVMGTATVGGDAHARFLDAAGPQVKLTGPKGAQTFSTAVQLPVAFTATDTLSEIGTTSVIVRRSAWNESFFSDAEVAAQVTESPGTFPAVGAGTYCISVQSKDSSNNLSQRSNERCITRPVDDNSMTGSGWKVTDDAASYFGATKRTTKKGATLTLKGIKAKRLALVVRKAANGGSVRVSLGSDVLGTFSLKGTGAKKVIPVAKFGKVRGGTVKITVVSPNGAPVAIDGLVVAK